MGRCQLPMVPTSVVSQVSIRFVEHYKDAYGPEIAERVKLPILQKAAEGLELRDEARPWSIYLMNLYTK